MSERQTGRVEGQCGKEVRRNLGCCVYKVEMAEVQTGQGVGQNPEGLMEMEVNSESVVQVKNIQEG